MKKTFSGSDVSIVANETSYDGFFKIRRVRLQHKKFAGGWSREITRELFVRGEAAAVMLYDPGREKVVMIEQFRIGALQEKSPWLIELVAGIVEPGEKPEEVAVREAQEEAGCPIERIYPICRYLPSAGGSCEAIHLFCGIVNADEADGIHGVEGEGEDIKVRVTGFADACAAMTSGVICDAASIIALQWLQLNRHTL